MPRLTLRSMMLLVALAAVILGAGKLADDHFGWTEVTSVSTTSTTTGGMQIDEATIRVFSPWPRYIFMGAAVWLFGGSWLAVALRRQPVVLEPPGGGPRP